MAAKHQGDSKTKRMAKKMPQKKGQKATKKLKRLQPNKQKKRQTTKAGKRMVLSNSSRIFAAKILRFMPKVRMETKARGMMKILLMDLYDHMSKEVESLSQNNDSPTIDSTAMRAVYQEAMNRQLAKHSAQSADNQADSLEAKAMELAKQSAEAASSEISAA